MRRPRSKLIDYLDREIISLLLENTGITQTEIAKKLGRSQSNIALRLARLKKMGLLHMTAGLDVEKFGLHLARIDVSTSDVTGLLNFAVKCPLFVNGFVSAGGKNVTLFYVAEDIRTLEALLNNHIRTLDGVVDVDFQPIFHSVKGMVLPLNINPAKGNQPPCGLPFCPSCPADVNYRGTFWQA